MNAKTLAILSVDTLHKNGLGKLGINAEKLVMGANLVGRYSKCG
jgi:hypothetical protein